MGKPREFWINDNLLEEEDGLKYVALPNETRRFKGIHVREVIPGITDTERLDYLILNEKMVFGDHNEGYYLTDKYLTTNFKSSPSPRGAIDAAMKEK